MRLSEMQLRYDQLLKVVSSMLRTQEEYFDGKKRNYHEPHKLQKCKELEATAQFELKQQFAIVGNSDLFFETDENRPLYKEYAHFVKRVAVLLTNQVLAFKNMHNQKQVAKCKALEREVKELIRARNEVKAPPVKPQTLF